MPRRPLDTGPLEYDDIAPPKDYAPRIKNVRSMNGDKDWTKTLSLIMALLVQFAGTVWWCSKINERVEILEKHDIARESQASDIAVMKSQIGDIKAWVDKQESRR